MIFLFPDESYSSNFYLFFQFRETLVWVPSYISSKIFKDLKSIFYFFGIPSSWLPLLSFNGPTPNNLILHIIQSLGRRKPFRWIQIIQYLSFVSKSSSKDSERTMRILSNTVIRKGRHFRLNQSVYEFITWKKNLIWFGVASRGVSLYWSAIECTMQKFRELELMVMIFQIWYGPRRSNWVDVRILF